MNNLAKINCLLLISMTLLFSCGSSKTFNKRHYNNRYYIGMSDRERTKNDKVLEDEVSTEVPAFTQERIITPPGSTHGSGSEGLEVTKQEQAVTEDLNSKEDASPDDVSGNSPDRSALRDHVSGYVNQYRVKQSDTMSEFKEGVSASSADGDALSLLWVIVIVLLILWVLGYAAGGFGLGGLIHVLLVIALILLILWLLRII